MRWNFNKKIGEFAFWSQAYLMPLFMWPYWTKFRIYKTVKYYWPSFTKSGARRKSKISILIDIAYLLVRFRFGLIFYMHYGLYNKNKVRSVFAHYLSDTKFYYNVLPKVNKRTWELDDKVIFSYICSLNSIPIPETVFTVRSQILRSCGGTVIRSNDDLYSLLKKYSNHRIIIKPALCGSSGEGIFEIKFDGNYWYKTDIGNRLNMCDLVTLADGNLIAQLCLNNSNLDPFASNASQVLHTYRILTYSDGATVTVLYVVRKMPQTSRLVDNGHYGAIYVGVNPHNGRLHRLGIDEQLREYKNDPITGIRFSEVMVSNIDELIQVAKDAAVVFLENKIIGWDISDTTDGIVVIEGNSSPGLALIQKTHNGCLKLKELIDAY